MPVYVIGRIHVRDPARWQEYVSQVGETISRHGGEVQFRGEQSRIFAGDDAAERVVVIKFADADAAERWHDSSDYQRLVAVRDAAADVTLVSYQA
ncbi:MAG: DUF1330 domain-containing protein [Burkholderiales bacterium]|nr:DUF1330 domain-containing protein [Burkholderiales bacterium]